MQNKGKGKNIGEVLRAEIVSGKYDITRKLPSDRMLMRRFSVARATVQAAMKEIVVGAKTIGSGDDWAQGYGFQFWRCQHGAFRADGVAGQLTVVIPSEDAVVSVNAGLGNMQRELDLI